MKMLGSVLVVIAEDANQVENILAQDVYAREHIWDMNKVGSETYSGHQTTNHLLTTSHIRSKFSHLRVQSGKLLMTAESFVRWEAAS
jgi:hypothetical protein